MNKKLAVAASEVNSPTPQNSNQQMTPGQWATTQRVHRALASEVYTAGCFCTADVLLRAIQQCIKAGWSDPPVRVLASMIHRGVRQVQRLEKQLAAAGRLRIIPRKIGPRRNDTNVYRVLEGGDSSNVGEVSKTNTNAKASRSQGLDFPPKLQNETEGLKTRLRWTEGKLAGTVARLDRIERENAQLRQQHDFFRRYCQRGEQIAWFSRKDEEAARMRMRAREGSIDYYSPPAATAPSGATSPRWP
jgi:hypothetical protein